ncbi:Gfo/Idh/MocA family protein [Elusimicrobiota bacterium]
MTKIGIIGLGYWGPNYVRNYLTMENCSIAAICDANAQMLQKTSRMYPFLKAASDHREVLEDNNIDAVVIATPASTHYKIVKEALESNKDVLVEKPLALDTKEGFDLARIAQNKKLILMVAYTFLYNSGVRALKELVGSGELGDIYYAHAARTNLGPIRKDVNALWDLAPHDLSILHYILGKWPVKVAAHGGVYIQDKTHDVVFGSLSYGDGVIANMHVSWLDPVKVRRVTVVGSKKMVLFDDLDPSPIKIYDKSVMKERFEKPYSSFEEFRLITRDSGVLLPSVAGTEPLRTQCAHFIDSVQSRKEPLTGPVMASEMIEVLLQLEKSLKQEGVSCPVSFDEKKTCVL